MRLLHILLLLVPTISLAQSTNIVDMFRGDFRQAEIYFRDLAFRNAIELYERELERNPGNLKAMLQIAESYRLMKDTRQAEQWYKAASEVQDLPPESIYNFAEVLASNQNYPEARTLYESYGRLNPSDSRTQSKLKFLDEMGFYLRDSSLYHVELASINSPAIDFGPVYYQEGVVFLSSRDQDLFIKHQSSLSDQNESLLDLYFTKELEPGKFGAVTKFQKEINSRFHEGPLSFGPEGNLIFTRNNFYKGKSGRSSDGKMKLKLFFAELDDNRNLHNMVPFEHNSDEYSTAHPYLSVDGTTLYFSSDMPGGIGGADLYISHKKDGQWSLPQNLGVPINTEGDEMFPFMIDGRLYFASDGHGGFGGLDIFFSIDRGNKFTDIINLGFPANSSHDDFSFVMHENGRRGLFASDREKVHDDNIYNYFIRHSVVAGRVIESEEDYPIDHVNVTLKDSEGRALGTTESNEEGRFHLDLPLDTEYTIEVTKKDFTPSHREESFTRKEAFDIDSVTIFMWAHDLFARGTIYGNETQQPLNHVQVVMRNHLTNKTDTFYTTDSGEYEFLLQHGNNYTMSFSKGLFVPLTQEINTMNITKGVIRNDFLMEEQFLEKGLVLFDFNDYKIKSEFLDETNKILKILKSNPSTFLIISAHADSRGTEEYNLKLSEKRAEQVLNYYQRNGISSERIIARAFGEALIINRCEDGINCHEEEHSKNRRVELKIEKELPEEELLNQE